MTNTQRRIQRTSRGVYLALIILRGFLILGLIMLILVSIWYADACTGGVWAGAMDAFPSLLGRMVPVFPVREEQRDVFLGYLVLQIIGQAILVAGTVPMARLFREISRTGTPFSGRYLRLIRWTVGCAAANFVVENVIYGLEGPLREGTVGFRPDILIGRVALLALIACLVCIFDYGCQLQQESDETL